MPSRRVFPFLLAILAGLVATSDASAQRGRVIITNPKIGLPPGRFVGEREDSQAAANIVKRDVWAPIYFSLKVDGELPQRASNTRLVVEAIDADDLRTSISYPLGNLLRDPGTVIPFGELASTPFVRFGDRNFGDITLTVYAGNSKLSDSVRLQNLRVRDASTYVVLSLGSRLPGFDLPRANQFDAGNANWQVKELRNGRLETAAITTLEQMPDQWFGYSTADLVVLTTGSAPNDFLSGLFSQDTSPENKAKLAALIEWVRRGGKLIISVAANAQILSQFPTFRQLIPAKLGDPANLPTAKLSLSWPIQRSLRVINPANATLEHPKKAAFQIARLTADPARPAQLLVPYGARQEEVPLVFQSNFGLGRITLVGFDLDRSPFTEMPNKHEFWDFLVRSAGDDLASEGTGQQRTQSYGMQNVEDEALTSLRTHIDTFDGVPVISFGFVALFIALYTLIIGPIEYLFLKKIVGRLELTWITFPIIVLSVSAAAYFTAYAIKGKDLKINKVDVVDVDLASGRVYGRTWFTVFSPRIDTYTVGVEPREAWAGNGKERASPPLVDWMGGGQSGGGNIVSRGYTYHTDPTSDPRRVADALESVPIQVWSTKAFTANWTAPLDTDNPLVKSNLYHPASNSTALRGTFVNNLPVKELQNAILLYQGKAYKLGTLKPGQEVRPLADNSVEDREWERRELGITTLGQNTQEDQWGRPQPRTREPQPTPTGSTSMNLWSILFHEKAIGSGRAPMNSSLRSLDQSWRLTAEFTNQAILIARVGGSTRESGQNTDEILSDPTGPSPTVLWLYGLPTSGDPRRPIPGTLRQETYIRVFLPVSAKRGP